MQNKNTQKILIDKVKLKTLQRLNCPEDAIIQKILYNNFIPQGDELIDLLLESLTDEKTFANWGGNRKNSGRKPNKNNNINQDEKIKLIKSSCNNQLVDKDKDKDKDIDKDKRFKKPTIEEINKYCLDRNNNINAEQFFDFYESKGWKVGNQPMKDWKASVRTWEKKEREKRTWRAAQGMFGVESGTYGKDIPL